MALAVISVAATALIGTAPAVAAPATWTVSNINPSGTGSLDLALTQAQNGDTISFNSDVTGTIFPTDSIELSNSVTINGPTSGDVSISGVHSGAIFTVDSGTTQSITHLTLEDATAAFGAAVQVGQNATVSLSHDVLTGNSSTEEGAAVDNSGGVVHSTDDTFSFDSVSSESGGGTGGAVGGNGTFTSLGDSFDHDTADGYAGAIDVFEGTLTVTGDSFTNDSAPAGGAIDVDNGGSAGVGTSTFANDSATATNGGAISVDQDSVLTANSDLFDDDTADVTSGDGGAIYDNGDAKVSLTNDTMTGNGADNGGGVYVGTPDGNAVAGAGLTVTATTLAQNTASTGSAIDNDGTRTAVHVTGSILESATPSCSGTVTDGGANVEDGRTCQFAGAGTAVVDKQIGLGALADNGGLTQTMAIAAGSVAQLLVPGTSCPALDQRGIARPTGSGVSCDAGAYELTGVASGTVTTLEDGGTGSLREEVADAQNGATIGFASGLSGTIALISPIEFHHDVAVSAPTGAITVSGSSMAASGGADVPALFEVHEGATVAIEGLSMTGDVYGAVSNAGTATLDNDVIDDNGSVYDGGAINNSGDLTADSDTISSNSTTVDGGAIDNLGTLTAGGDTFNADTAAEGGGAIYNTGDATVTGSDFTGNSATSEGGAFANQAGANASISTTTFSDNSTTGTGTGTGGGGIVNRAERDIHNDGPFLSLSADTFVGNSSASDGGAIENYGSIDSTNSTLTANTASAAGAAVAVEDNGSQTVPAGFHSVNDTIADNSSPVAVVDGQLGTVEFTGAILENHPSTNCAHQGQAQVVDGGGNVTDDTSCGIGGLGNDQTTAHIGLGSLAANGGPTSTIAIGAGSVADKLESVGTNSIGTGCPATDQRGHARPHSTGDKCDAGAFEFDPVPPRVLTIARAGAGAGDVTGAGISCGSTCTHSYSDGATVTLTAHVRPESTFVKWSGGGCSGKATCTVTMDTSETVTATFSLIAAPTTRITSVKLSGKHAAFGFRGSGGLGVLTYRCRLDTRSWLKCAAPKRYVSKAGKHRFEVYAVDAHDRRQARPTVRTFTLH